MGMGVEMGLNVTMTIRMRTFLCGSNIDMASVQNSSALLHGVDYRDRANELRGLVEERKFRNG